MKSHKEDLEKKLKNPEFKAKYEEAQKEVKAEVEEAQALEIAVKEMTGRYDKKAFGDSKGGHTKKVIEICHHYAEHLGMTPLQVFEALEKKRTVTYPSYYCWSATQFPKIDDVMVFETMKELRKKVEPEKGYRCPACGGISKDKSVCDSGVKSGEKVCDWKVYGIFGDMGKGLSVIVKKNWPDEAVVHHIFMPIALEEAESSGK